MFHDDISAERQSVVVALLGRILSTTGQLGAASPPEVRDNISVLDADDVIEWLIDTDWTIDDGTGERTTLSFDELMALLYNLERILREKEASASGLDLYWGPPPTSTISFDVNEILQPDTVRRLLSGFRPSKPPDGLLRRLRCGWQRWWDW